MNWFEKLVARLHYDCKNGKHDHRVSWKVMIKPTTDGRLKDNVIIYDPPICSLCGHITDDPCERVIEPEQYAKNKAVYASFDCSQVYHDHSWKTILVNKHTNRDGTTTQTNICTRCGKLERYSALRF